MIVWVDVLPILGKPWVDGGCDEAVGFDCAGVCLWVLERIGVAREDLPVFPTLSQNKPDPDELARCSALWVNVPLASRMRIGDVILSRMDATNIGARPHLAIIVKESPCMVASSVDRAGVIVRSAAHLHEPQFIYRWPAAAAIVGATC